MILFSELEVITQGKTLRFAKDEAVSTLLTDSRKAIGGDGALFFAINGEHHDGHRYLEDLYARGIRQFIVEREPESLAGIRDVNVLQVHSSLEALQQIAAHHR